jgi:hypothetical protein
MLQCLILLQANIKDKNNPNNYFYSFCVIGFFNEANTLESSSIMIYPETHEQVYIHNELGEMPHQLNGNSK